MALPQLFEFYVRPRILCGPRTVREVGFEAKKLGGTAAVIVTDRLLHQAGLVQKVVDGLAGSGVTMGGIFDDVPPNSEVGVVERGADFARAAGCDLLIALGGGSVMDTAKAMNVLLIRGGQPARLRGRRAPHPPPPAPDRHSHHCGHGQRGHPRRGDPGRGPGA